MSTDAPVSAAALQQFTRAAFSAVGVPSESAAILAEALVESDLAGHDTHGVLRLPIYVGRVLDGGTPPDARPEVIHDFAASALVDGHDGWGPVNAGFAMRLAVEKARTHGLGMVGVIRSGHLGRLGTYPLIAAEAGMIGACLGNASARLAPWGGRRPFLGNNPWSVAVPAGAEPPVLVDMANSIASAGKLRLLAGAGQPLPEGWALDSEGLPTTDPRAALAGLLQPMAGHKGYGITLLVDIMAGVLTGGAWGPAVLVVDKTAQKQNSCHLLVAIDPACFGDRDAFRQRMDAYIREVKAVPPAVGVAEVLLPGERSLRTRARRLAAGIPLAPATRAALAELAIRLQLPLPW